MINEERLMKALRYLSETDEPAAELLAMTERLEFKAKAMRDTVFLMEEGTVAERQAKAGSHVEYVKSMEAYFEALKESQHLKNKRGTESIVVDAWRSLNSARNKGNL